MPRRFRFSSIGAHPADIFNQSGGTMAHHAARGDWVGCIVLTHGARVHEDRRTGDHQ
jgi:LmbE family N-acetylglucosaminyl deacetylase